MAKHFTEDEKRKIVELRGSGASYHDIAVALSRFKPDGTPHYRSIMEQYTKLKNNNQISVTPVSPPVIEKVVSLGELSKGQRIEYLRSNLDTNPRFKNTLNSILSPSEREMFLHEYFQVISEQDSLNNAEEQQLFTAILNLILFYRARERDNALYNNFINKVPNSTGQIMPYDTRWQDEAKECYTQYERGMKALKLSREQRLKDMEKIGNTFLDFAELLAKHENQEKIIEDIMYIERATDEEMKKFQENGWLISGKLPNNNPEVNYGSK